MENPVRIGDATLYLGDCLEILPTLPKVDAVVTDLAAGAAGEHLVYAEGEFDLLACVALDVRKVAYLPPSMHCQTVHIRTHDDPNPPKHGGKGGKTFSQYPFAVAMREVLNG
jgi:hypothetical protein